MEKVQNGAAFKAFGWGKTNSMKVKDSDDDGGGDEENDQ